MYIQNISSNGSDSNKLSSNIHLYIMIICNITQLNDEDVEQNAKQQKPNEWMDRNENSKWSAME